MAWPTKNSGDATSDFGFGESWSAVDAALKQRGRGLLGGFSNIRSLLVERLGATPGPCRDSNNITEQDIVDASERFRQARGKLPMAGSGDASEFMQTGQYETWARLNSALARGSRGLPGGSSLSKLLHARGLRDSGARDLGEGEIRKAVALFLAVHGHLPSTKSGDASDYIGRDITWEAIGAKFRRGEFGDLTFSAFLGDGPRKKAVKKNKQAPLRPLVLEDVREAVRRWVKVQQAFPSRRSGSLFLAEESITFSSLAQAVRSGGRGLPRFASWESFLASCVSDED